MRQAIYILIYFTLIACTQSPSRQTSTVKITKKTDELTKKPQIDSNLNSTENLTIPDQLEAENELLQNGFEKATPYKLTDTIIADLNGDGVMDKAIYKKDKKNSGITIIDGQTNIETKIGFGQKFDHLTSFDWVDYWGIVEDKETTETTFDKDGDVLGSKIVKLQNPSIFIGQSELGGGLITFLNGEFLWIHQTC